MKKRRIKATLAIKDASRKNQRQLVYGTLLPQKPKQSDESPIKTSKKAQKEIN